MDNKNNRIMKNIIFSAVLVQAIAVLITVYMFMDQENIKKIFTSGKEIAEIHSLPVEYMLINICPFILYLIFYICHITAENKNGQGRMIPAVFFGVCCAMKVILEFLFQFSGVYYSLTGMTAVETASRSVLNSAIAIASRPCSVIAFGLFCLAAGMKLYGEKTQRVILANAGENTWEK